MPPPTTAPTSRATGPASLPGQGFLALALRHWWLLLAGALVIVGVDLALVYAATQVHPSRVGSLPWEASAGIDSGRRAREAFATTGRITVVMGGGGLTVACPDRAGADRLGLELYRPSDPDLDQRLEWDGGPRHLVLGRPGRWVLRVHARVGSDAGVVWERDIEAGR